MKVDGSERTQRTFDNTGKFNSVLSRNGAFIVYDTFESSGSGIYVLPLGANTPRFLVAGLFPTLTPDDKSVIFSGQGGIEKINLDGSGRKIISGLSGAEPSVSHNGQKITFTRIESDPVTEAPRINIYIADVNGTNTRFVTEGEDPSFSADGKSLVYVQGSDNIVTIDIDGKNRRTLIASDSDNEAYFAPSWGPAAF
jgi:hypothetical protein